MTEPVNKSKRVPAVELDEWVSEAKKHDPSISKSKAQGIVRQLYSEASPFKKSNDSERTVKVDRLIEAIKSANAAASCKGKQLPKKVPTPRTAPKKAPTKAPSNRQATPEEQPGSKRPKVTVKDQLCPAKACSASSARIPALLFRPRWAAGQPAAPPSQLLSPAQRLQLRPPASWSSWSEKGSSRDKCNEDDHGKEAAFADVASAQTGDMSPTIAATSLAAVCLADGSNRSEVATVQEQDGGERKTPERRRVQKVESPMAMATAQVPLTEMLENGMSTPVGLHSPVRARTPTAVAGSPSEAATLSM